MEHNFISTEKVKDLYNAKRYINFINSRIELNKTRNIDNICEVHHIIPKSLGGTNSKSNLIKLTYREHFIAHLILFKVYKTKGMAMAVMMMSNHINKSSRLYEIEKKNIKKLMSSKVKGEKNPMYNKLVVYDKNDNRIVINKHEYDESIHTHIVYGEKNPMYGKNHTAESKQKISQNNAKPFLGRTHTEESKKLISDKLKGHTHTEESKRKMSLSKTGSKNHCAQAISINGVTYSTIKEAMDTLNIGRKMIVHRCIISKNPKFDDWFYL